MHWRKDNEVKPSDNDNNIPITSIIKEIIYLSEWINCNIVETESGNKL